MGWHDVASRLRGPAVADVGHHVAQRWQAVTGERLEAQPTGVVSAGDVELQIVRTVPEKLYEFAPRGDFRIIEAYLRALRSARHLVYLENQFLWSPEIVNSCASDRLARSSTSEAITNPGGLSGWARGNPGPPRQLSVSGLASA
jgi:phosphatidylserine/phosphatidylglycerophosphate/cardiolipin synthase-like enzyme